MPEMAHDWLNKVFYSILFYSILCSRRRSFVNRYGFKVYPINYFTRILVKNLIGQKKLYRKLQVSGWNSDLDRSEAC